MTTQKKIQETHGPVYSHRRYLRDLHDPCTFAIILAKKGDGGEIIAFGADRNEAWRNALVWWKKWREQEMVRKLETE